MFHPLGRVASAEEREARRLSNGDQNGSEHEMASEEREAGGGVGEEREAGERDEHVPRIGTREL
jgi:hypothetical protein